MKCNTLQYEGLIKEMNTGSFMILIFIAGLVMAFLITFIFQRRATFVMFIKMSRSWFSHSINL